MSATHRKRQRFDDRLEVVLPAALKQRIATAADRENEPVSVLVRRALIAQFGAV